MTEKTLRKNNINMLKEFAKEFFNREQYFISDEILDYIGEAKYYLEKGDTDKADDVIDEATTYCLNNGALDMYDE